ncbi:RNA-binding protein YlmH [Lachnospiraceae bacterium PF1-21]|uniref:YlmH family RNA-binding protein n=1 Tax=Ohessyouella blattaphilus TaxID=2949333 RepID=UPI003E2C81A7
MTKEEQLLQNRLIELSEWAYSRNIAVYSDFLGLNEQNILHTTPKGLFASSYTLIGGYDNPERQMARFSPDALYYEEISPPLQVLAITPVNKRFAEDLSHRDYLGSLMNLGVVREKFGDIVITETVTYIFVTREIAAFICEKLSKVRHTSVKCQVLDTADIHYEPRTQEISGSVKSVRLDAVLATAFPLSRSKLTPLIEGGLVYVNGKLITSNGYSLKDGDIISVRGHGRLKYLGSQGTSKKGKQIIQVLKYI